MDEREAGEHEHAREHVDHVRRDHDDDAPAPRSHRTAVGAVAHQHRADDERVLDLLGDRHGDLVERPHVLGLEQPGRELALLLPRPILAEVVRKARERVRVEREHVREVLHHLEALRRGLRALRLDEVLCQLLGDGRRVRLLRLLVVVVVVRAVRLVLDLEILEKWCILVCGVQENGTASCGVV